MFNLSSRVQAACNQALTSSIVITGIIILLTFIQLYKDNVWSIDSTTISNIKPTVSIKHSFQYGSNNRKPKENSKIQFDLQSDLSSLFNWNTKQIFIYLTAEYPGKNEDSNNKVTFWDKIITNKKNSKLNLKNQRGKYSVWDIEKSFRGRNATVRLEWNIQPYIGPLIFGETKGFDTFQFADTKKKN